MCETMAPERLCVHADYTYMFWVNRSFDGAEYLIHDADAEADADADAEADANANNDMNCMDCMNECILSWMYSFPPEPKRRVWC